MWRVAIFLVVTLVVGIETARVVQHLTRFTEPGGPAPAQVRLIEDLATVRVALKAIVIGRHEESGWLGNTDEVLIECRLYGDFGYDLAALTRADPGAPRLLDPGFTSDPPRLLDQRTTRWLSDPTPGQLKALLACRAQAEHEAAARVARLGALAELDQRARRSLGLLAH